MAIKPGTGTIQRRHAKNYIDRQADARLKECIAPYQKQGLHSLGVDSFEILYYGRADSNIVCTCQQTQVLPEHSLLNPDLPPNLVKSDSLVDSEIVIDYARPLFGQHGESFDSDDDTESDEFALDEDSYDVQGPVVDNLFASRSDCGICYRGGLLPAFELFGYQRYLLTTHNINDTYGYTIDVTSAPHSFVKVDERQGYVEFVIEVPKYFKNVRFSIRNNAEVLTDQLYFGNAPLTLLDLKDNAGSEVQIRVTTTKFTHAVIEFDLGIDPIRANISQMRKATDWSMFDTLGNLDIILPMTIKDVPNGSVIHVPTRNITLKTTDKGYLRTANDQNLDWQVSTRVLQPQEALRNIARAQKLW